MHKTKLLNKKKFVAIAAIMLGVLMFFGLDIYYIIVNPVGWKNDRICNSIEPGITYETLIDILDEPYSESNVGTDHWVYFNTPSINADPIKAMIDKDQNRVMVLRCVGDGPDTWSIKK